MKTASLSPSAQSYTPYTTEATLAERGQVVIPKKARDALGLLPNMKLEIIVERDRLIITKPHKLDLSKWIGSVPDDGFTTDQVMAELRGRVVPHKSTAKAKRI
jgi:AbrB family looped-hinge helix DNA binding protein